MIANAGEKGAPVVILMAEDQLIYLEAHKFHASFLENVEWVERAEGPGDVGVLKSENGAH